MQKRSEQCDLFVLRLWQFVNRDNKVSVARVMGWETESLNSVHPELTEDKEKPTAVWAKKTHSGGNEEGNGDRTASSPDHGEWLKLGTVGPAHGIKGSFFCYTDDRRTEVIPYKRVMIGSCRQSPAQVMTVRPKVYEVRQSFLSAGKPVLALQGLSSREQIEELAGATIYVSRSETNLAKNEFFVGDLVGLMVQSASQTGTLQTRGSVIAVHHFGAQFNLEIELTPETAPDSNTTASKTIDCAVPVTILFPFMDSFIADLNLKEKILVVQDLDAFI